MPTSLDDPTRASDGATVVWVADGSVVSVTSEAPLRQPVGIGREAQHPPGAGGSVTASVSAALACCGVM